MSVYIGIDLGTENSRLGYWHNGRVEIIPNEFGDKVFPSIVKITDFLQANKIEEQISTSIPNIKRIIGQNFDEIKTHNFENIPIRKNESNNRILIDIEIDGEIISFSPEEICAIFLKKMKIIAEKYLIVNIDSFVISVPSYFNDSQREAIKDAAFIAGLSSTRLITDPVANIICYDFGKNSSEINSLVLDFGSGGFSISIINLDDNIIEVLSTVGNSRVGGQDFDFLLVNHFIKEFELQHKNITWNSIALEKLKIACEKAKILLSSECKAKIEIHNLFDGIDFYSSITRDYFESLCENLFNIFMKSVKQVIRDSKISKSSISKVILAGGSSFIPKIKQLLSEFFEEEKEFLSLCPESAVFGAAISAGIMSGNNDPILENILFLDVCCYSIGLETDGEIMSFLIHRNSNLPCKVSKSIKTTFDNQCELSIDVFEGERGLTKYNRKLGTFNIYGLMPAPKGVQIEVEFELDPNGIFSGFAFIRSRSAPKLICSFVKGKFDVSELILKREELAKYR